MGTGYTRNDTSNNIADGNVASAADLDGEFDALVDAFNSSTGHTHDGTSAEGAPITVVGPAQEYVGSGTSLSPKTDSTYDLGTTSVRWATGYLDDLTVTTNITVGGTVDGRDVAADGTKLDGVEASADVTDTANVTAAGALMDSELTSIASVKALNQGVATTDTPTFAGVITGGNVDGRDVSVDGTKLDTIETNADVTDTANVAAAGALMDSEVDVDIKTLSLPANTTISAYGATLVDDANAATARTTLGLAIGTNVQAWDADLDTWATKTAPSGTVVGTTDTQTLSGKTLTSPAINTGISGTAIASTAEAEAGALNTKLMTPLRVAEAITALAPAPTNILGSALAGPADVPTIAVTAGTTVVREGAEALGMGYAAVNLSTSSTSYVIGAQYTVSQAYSGTLRFYATQTAAYTGGGSGTATSSLYLRKNGVTISSVFTVSGNESGSGSAVRSFDSTVASGDLFEWMHEVSGLGTSTLSAVSVGGDDLYVAATPMIKASENPF